MQIVLGEEALRPFVLDNHHFRELALRAWPFKRWVTHKRLLQKAKMSAV